MIAPRNRLLVWFAIVGVPFAALAGIEPSTTGVCVALIAAFGAVAVWDAVRSRRAFDGIRLVAPPVSRMAIDRAGEIDLRVRNEARRRRLLRVALPLPPGFAAPEDDLDVSLPAGAEWARLPWPCTPGKRGAFAVTGAHLESSSPLGLWNARLHVPLDAEIRVYPDMQKERQGLGLLFRGASGIHAQRQVGKGREFEKLRDYVAGDGLEDIHWKATARRGRPITKVFQVERTQEVYVAIDTSRLSAREDAIERHISTALLIGMAAERQGDLFGLLAFSDRVDRFVRARSGASHYHACRDAIYALQPRAVNPDFDEVCSFIRMRLRRRALVIVLTALDDPLLAEHFLRDVDIIARQHLVLVGMMNPTGVAPMFSHGGASTEAALYDELGGHLRWHNLEQVGRQLLRRGVKLAVYDGEQMALRLVSDYLTIKNRQVL
jgi:uncharacterized protein (DUF58 family)